MKETFQVLTCERCGVKAEIRKSTDDIGWGQFSTWTRVHYIGRNLQEQAAQAEFKRTDILQELCPNCFDGLRDWWLLGEVPGGRVRRAIDRAKS